MSDPSAGVGTPPLDLDKLIASTNSAPALDPAMHVGIAAQAPDPATAASNAATTAGLGTYVTWANNLTGMSAGAQQSTWNSLPPEEQQGLTAAGYKGPPATHHSGGLLSDLEHGNVFGALGRVATDTGAIVGATAKPILQAAGSGLRAVQHGYRTLEYLAQSQPGQLPEAKQGLIGIRPNLGAEISAMFSPKDWENAWNQTEHGEQTYDPATVRALTQQFGADGFGTVKRMADTGLNTTTLAALPDGDALVKRMTDDPGFAAAVRGLLNAKLSPGRQVAAPLFAKHPAVANVLSGTIDAAFDWFGDPVNGALAGLHDANEARYVVSGPEDVYRLANADPAVGKVYPKVQQALAEIDGFLAQPDTAVTNLTQRFPTLANVAGVLGKKITRGTMANADDFVDWLADGSAGTSAWMRGNALPITKMGTTMLRSGPLSDLAFDAKSKLTDTIDFLGGSKIPIVGGLARSVDRITNLVPAVRAFDANSGQAPTIIGQIARAFLPNDEADAIVNRFALADTTAEKRVVYKGMLVQIGELAGLNDNPKVSQWWAKYVDAAVGAPGADSEALPRAYSGATADRLPINGQQVPSGVLAGQTEGKWAIPDYATMVAAKNKVTLGDRLLAAVNTDGIDAFMQQAWKPLQILRLGFAPRVAAEELFGAMLRADSPLNLIRARLGVSAAQGLERLDAAQQAAAAGELAVKDYLLPWSPVSHIWDTLAERLPENVVAKVDTASEAWSQMMGQKAMRAFHNVEGALAGERYVQAARQLWSGGYAESSFTDLISAMHGDGMGYLDDPSAPARASRKGIEHRPVMFAPTGNFRNYENADPLFAQVYRKALSQIASDPLGRAALRSFGDRDVQVQDVIDAINSDAMETIREGANRYTYLRDGRQVGVDATQEEATRDWANTVVDHVNGYVTDHAGNLVPGVSAAGLLRGQVPSVDAITATDRASLPLAVHGQEVVPVAGPSAYRRFLNTGFRELVGRPMDWMVRQPMFLHNFVLARDEVEGLREVLAADPSIPSDSIDNHLTDVAVERAVNRTIPFIHDPQVRSQFAVNTRNLMPFEFAQEQFYKRWARTFAYAPEAFRQAQLVNQGLRHSGLVRVDANGNEYFDYPLVGQAQQAVLGPAINAILGVNAQLPVTPGFAGDVKYATPGLERLGVPSFGPLISVPLKVLSQRFPELQPVQTALLGNLGAQTSIAEQFIPATVYRFYQALAPPSQLQEHYASTMAQAAQYLDATGHGLPDNATTHQKQSYIDRLTNWTRVTLILRAVLGFVGPTAPQITPGPQTLPDELKKRMQVQPINEAVKSFVAEHPDATAYTVFGSTTPGKADLPAAQGTLDFMDANHQFLQNYPLAAGWLVPAASNDGNFNDTAYREQLAMGLRQRKSIGTVLDDVTYARDSPAYFASLDDYDKMKLANHGNSTGLASVERAWSDWSNAYLASHPVFADILQSSTAKADRAKIVQDLHAALADPGLPHTPTTSAVKGLIDSYLDFQRMQQSLNAQHTSLAYTQVAALENAFATWSAQYVADNPLAAPLYNRIVRPDVGGTEALAQQVAANTASAAPVTVGTP